jgi:predicted Ser/Thr protein kinase
MVRQINPFIYGKPVPPSHFVGREAVIDHCYNRLAGPVRTSIAISGEHGIGKTSLLYFLKHLAEKEEWGRTYGHILFALLDCQAVKQFTPTRFWRRALDSLKEAVENPALRQQIDDLLEKPELDHTYVKRLLRWLDQNGFSLILLLDSFTWIVKSHGDEPARISGFLAGLRALTNQPDYALTLITASREPLNLLCADIVKDYPGSYFYNNFALEILEPFTPDEIKALLKRAEGSAADEFQYADVDFLSRVAGAHPALLQMAGFFLFEARRRTASREEARKEALRDFERAANNYFSLFWNESTPLERTLFVLIILSQIVEQPSIQVDLTREEIQALLNRYERDLMNLVDRGLVQKVGDTFQVSALVFARWIVREIASKGEAILAEHRTAVTDETLRQAWLAMIDVAPLMTIDALRHALVRRSPLALDTLPPVPSRYELQAELGRGASSVVYKAFDTHLDRTVAIKLLHGHIVTGPESSRHRLLKEARAASKLQHPHIVTIYDAIEFGDHIYLIMEYVDGQSLADHLHEKERLRPEEVIDLIGQAADALDYAHKQGVIHRDIKPANLLITNSGALKLADFGIAKVIGAPQTTEEGEFKGTVTYMSPEQVKQQPFDGRSDLFSLATVAFQMLSGSSPWPDTSVVGILNNIEKGNARYLTDFAVRSAFSLEPVFRKALAENPEDRYQTGSAFVEALEQAIISEPSREVESDARRKPTVFVSYSHVDEKWKDRLITHLGVLQIQGLLDLWDDHRIEAGEDWQQEIQEAMATARVAILLVSADFLASRFIQGEEVPRLLERRDEEGVHIFPIIVRPCAWKRVRWLTRLQVRPKYGHPLSDGTEHQIDADLAVIADEVAGIIDRTTSAASLGA